MSRYISDGSEGRKGHRGAAVDCRASDCQRGLRSHDRELVLQAPDQIDEHFGRLAGNPSQSIGCRSPD